jgi:hypothetical protein
MHWFLIAIVIALIIAIAPNKLFPDGAKEQRRKPDGSEKGE